ncbi:MAG: hypothetical protein JW995_14145 [Melioribacteraceae bacterium]|nr:hypothetical protein [Melioribacteraceae bacterium]
MKSTEERYNELLSNKSPFFQFMRERYPLFFNSNIFLRDIQYAIRTYFERKNILISYTEAEELMKKFTQHLESEGQLVRLNYNSWKVNFSL